VTNFKLISAAAILAAIATPVLAQPAVDEPGMHAFYESLGVGSHNEGTKSARPSAPRSHVRVRHVAAKDGTNAHK
jgi:hypothetical protein